MTHGYIGNEIVLESYQNLSEIWASHWGFLESCEVLAEPVEARGERAVYSRDGAWASTGVEAGGVMAGSQQKPLSCWRQPWGHGPVHPTWALAGLPPWVRVSCGILGNGRQPLLSGSTGPEGVCPGPWASSQLLSTDTGKEKTLGGPPAVLGSSMSSEDTTGSEGGRQHARLPEADRCDVGQALLLPSAGLHPGPCCSCREVLLGQQGPLPAAVLRCAPQARGSTTQESLPCRVLVWGWLSGRRLPGPEFNPHHHKERKRKEAR